MQRESRPSGVLRTRVIPAPPKRPAILTVADALRYGASAMSFTAKGRYQRANATHFSRSIDAQAAAEDSNALTLVGHLWLAKVDLKGKRIDLGLVSCRVVTTAGVNFIVDAFQGLVEPEVMRFHGVGTGAAAEAVGNTALTTELTTQYSVASTRPTGSLGEQAGNANVFETAATITVSAAVAITEHGVFSQAAVAGGVLLDRSVFAAVNLASGESLQATYDLTFTAGG